MSTGQWMQPADGAAWFFDAGADSLDFAHTGSVGDDAEGESLQNPADLAAWLGRRFARIALDEATERDLTDAIGLRIALGSLFATRADGEPLPADAVDTVNLFAAVPDIPPALAGGQRQAGAGHIRLGQALSTLARDGISVLSEAEPDRVRRCAADDCRIVFHDESRTNNRRWCSMERCGNRAKVRAHRERAAMRRHLARGAGSA